jgi:hypothetical protein
MLSKSAHGPFRALFAAYKDFLTLFPRANIVMKSIRQNASVGVNEYKRDFSPTTKRLGW